MSEKAWADVAVPQIFGRASNEKELEMRLSQLANDELLVNDRRRSNPGEPNYSGYKQYQLRLLEMIDYLLPQSVAEVRNLKQTLGEEKPYTLVFNGAETSVFQSATADWVVQNFKLKDFVLT